MPGDSHDPQSRSFIGRRPKGWDSAIVKAGLTLEEAQEHCANPDTSSQTTNRAEGARRTSNVGPWFDHYEPEARKDKS